MRHMAHSDGAVQNERLFSIPTEPARNTVEKISDTLN
jgi:hypothetical protein